MRGAWVPPSVEASTTQSRGRAAALSTAPPGVAGKLARAALEYAREHNLSVIPRCPFVAAYIRKHPEYQSLVQADR
ncbi:MAG: hypothetical protein DMF77_23120 [Acidobacteria bacterium]|nr:MAG: hypothetical protein DMF77_23120 [Acidobacteriota bacterium]